MKNLQTCQSSLNYNPRKPRPFYDLKLLWIQLNDTQLSSLDVPCRSNYSFLLTLILIITVSKLTIDLLFTCYP
jgi:hypothetical protein